MTIKIVSPAATPQTHPAPTMYSATTPLCLIAVLCAIFGTTPAAAADTASTCAKIFLKSTAISDEFENDKNSENQQRYLHQRALSIVAAAQTYLRRCTDPEQALSAQLPALRGIEPALKQNCPDNAAAIELIDLHHDGKPALILHTQLMACQEMFTSMFDAGFSAIFFRNAGHWTGRLLWPLPLLENQSAKMRTEDFIEPQFKPKIEMLPFRDSKQRTFMTLVSRFDGGDYSEQRLFILRWDGLQPATVLRLALKDWCGQPTSWIISNDGQVIVPGAAATDRCTARSKKVYSLEHLKALQ